MRWAFVALGVITVGMLSVGHAQAVPPAPAPIAIGGIAKTFTDADILDMFGPAAPRRQVHWGSVFRFGGMILTGATWVYGALNYLYSTLDEAASGMYDAHLDAEFGIGEGVIIARAFTYHHPSYPTVTGGHWSFYGSTVGGSNVSGGSFDGGMTLAEAQTAASAAIAGSPGAVDFVSHEWTQVDNSQCGIGGRDTTACSVVFGYVPLATRMETGVAGRPYGAIKNATGTYADDHPLSETWPGLYPGMSWATPAPNVNQWTDRLVNPGLDSDGDGYSDGWEVGVGTDPSDPDSHPEGNPDVRPVPVVPEPGTGGQPVPQPGIGPAPEPDLDPAPGVTPGPAPEPDPGDRPQPVAPGEPGYSPDPEDKPGETEPGTEEEADATTECWPLACEESLVKLVNAAREGNRLSGDMWEQLSYQSDLLLAEHAQLVYQSELALAELAYSEYEVVLLESQLENDNWRNRALQAQLDEAEYQRSVHLATLSQLEFQSDALVEQLEWQIYLAETQADLVVQAEFQSDMQGRMVSTQESILAELQAEGAALPEFQPVVLPAADLSELTAWQPDTEPVALLFEGLADDLEAEFALVRAGMDTKFPFAITSMVTAPPAGVFSTDCPVLQMQSLPGAPAVDVCSGPLDHWLSTVGRSAMGAILTFGFIWLAFGWVRNA